LSDSYRIAKELEPFARDLGTLTLDPENAREHDDANLLDIANSLKTYGQQKPVVVNSAGKIVAGNGTVRAALSLGWTKLACVTFDGKLEDEEGFAIADNRSAERATWNEARLGPVFERYRAAGLNLRERLGFKENEAQSILVRLGRGQVKEDAGATSAEAERFRVQAGDLWLLGDHRLLCGDMTDEATLARLMGEERGDLVFTDPPYGVNVTGAGGSALHGDISFTLIPLLFAKLDEYAKPKAWLYLCGGQSNMLLYSKLFEQYFRDLPRVIVWHKSGPPVLRRVGYHSSFELIYYGFRAGSGDHWFGGRGAEECSDVWSIPTERGGERFHPTQKPVEVPARAITNSCSPGGIVVDPFAGSGSTLIAAEQRNRRCYAMELDPNYCSRIVARWAKFTGGTPSRAGA